MDRIHVTFQPMPIIRTQRVRNYLNMINSLNQIDNILDEPLNQAISDDNSVSEEFKNNLKEINVTEEMRPPTYIPFKKVHRGHEIGNKKADFKQRLQKNISLTA